MGGIVKFKVGDVVNIFTILGKHGHTSGNGKLGGTRKYPTSEVKCTCGKTLVLPNHEIRRKNKKGCGWECNNHHWNRG